MSVHEHAPVLAWWVHPEHFYGGSMLHLLILLLPVDLTGIRLISSMSTGNIWIASCRIWAFFLILVLVRSPPQPFILIGCYSLVRRWMISMSTFSHAKVDGQRCRSSDFWFGFFVFVACDTQAGGYLMSSMMLWIWSMAMEGKTNDGMSGRLLFGKAAWWVNGIRSS